MFVASRRRSGPSTVKRGSRSKSAAIAEISASDSSFARRCGSMLSRSHTSRAVVGPSPRMYRREMCVGLSGGMSTPWIRGMCPTRLSVYVKPLALPLLVAGGFVGDWGDALPLDQLALIANPADARSHLHDPPARQVGFSRGARKSGQKVPVNLHNSGGRIIDKG